MKSDRELIGCIACRMSQTATLEGLAFVLVRFERRRVYRVPVDVWSDAVQYHAYGIMQPRVDGWKPKNTASLCETDMKPEWAVRNYDYLGALNNATD